MQPAGMSQHRRRRDMTPELEAGDIVACPSVGKVIHAAAMPAIRQARSRRHTELVRLSRETGRSPVDCLPKLQFPGLASAAWIFRIPRTGRPTSSCATAERPICARSGPTTPSGCRGSTTGCPTRRSTSGSSRSTASSPTAGHQAVHRGRLRRPGGPGRDRRRRDHRGGPVRPGRPRGGRGRLQHRGRPPGPGPRLGLPRAHRRSGPRARHQALRRRRPPEQPQDADRLPGGRLRRPPRAGRRRRAAGVRPRTDGRPPPRSPKRGSSEPRHVRSSGCSARAPSPSSA